MHPALIGVGLFAACAAAHAQDFGNVQTVVTGLNEPVSLSPIPGDDTRLVVAEHAGKLRLIRVLIDDDGNRSFVLEDEPFLDLAALDASNPFFRSADSQPLQDRLTEARERVKVRTRDVDQLLTGLHI